MDKTHQLERTKVSGIKPVAANAGECIGECDFAEAKYLNVADAIVKAIYRTLQSTEDVEQHSHETRQALAKALKESNGV